MLSPALNVAPLVIDYSLICFTLWKNACQLLGSVREIQLRSVRNAGGKKGMTVALNDDDIMPFK